MFLKFEDLTPRALWRIVFAPMGTYQRGWTLTLNRARDLGAPFCRLSGNPFVILLGVGFGGRTAIDAGRSARAWRDQWQPVAVLRSDNTAEVAGTAGSDVVQERVLSALVAELQLSGYAVTSPFLPTMEHYDIVTGERAARHEVERNRNINRARLAAGGGRREQDGETNPLMAAKRQGRI